MARLDYFTIIIGAICIAAAAFLVWIGISKVKDNGKEDVAELYNDLQTYDENDKEDYYIDKEEGKKGGSTTSDPSTASNTSNTPMNDEDLEYDFLNEKPKESNASTSNTSTSSVSTRPSSSGGGSRSSGDGSSVRAGDYMVLAGSFKDEANAERQAQKIRNLGYNSTRVERFNRGAYAVVLVNRFSDMGSARDLKKELIARGVDSFVKQKQ